MSITTGEGERDRTRESMRVFIPRLDLDSVIDNDQPFEPTFHPTVGSLKLLLLVPSGSHVVLTTKHEEQCGTRVYR